MGGWFSRSLIARILAILAAAVFAAAGLLTAFQIQQVNRLLEKEINQQGKIVSHLVAESLTFDLFLDDRAKVAETLPRELNEVENAEIAVVLKAGESLDQPPFGLYQHAGGALDNTKPASSYLPGGQIPKQSVVRNNIIYFPSPLTLAGDGEESTELGTLVLGLSRKQMVRAQRQTLISATASSLFVAVILVALCFVFTRRAFAPLRSAVDAIQVMARGDLRQALPPAGADEVGQLIRELDRFSAGLKEVLRNTQEAELRTGQVVDRITEFSSQLSSGVSRSADAFQQIIGQIKASDEDVRQILQRTDRLSTIAEEASSSSTEMTASAEEVARNADKAFRYVEENVTSVNEISHTMNQVTRDTRELGDLIRTQQEAVAQMAEGLRSIADLSQNNQQLAITTSEKAREEADLVGRLNETMSDLVQRADDSIGQIRQMAKETENITEILDLIKEIGEQVSLLSINASIIAAQSSGAEGKAFGVVAEEIKNLSSRTLASTSDIARIIRQVQEVAGRTESYMSEMIDRIRRSAEEVATSKRLTTELMARSEDARSTAENSRRGADGLVYKADALKDSADKVRIFSQSVLRSSEEVAGSSAASLKNLESMMSFAEEVKNATEEQSRGTAIIGQSVGGLVEMIEEFNRAARSLQKETSGIRVGTEALQSHTRTNQKLSEEMKEAVSLLQETSQRLHSILSRFRI